MHFREFVESVGVQSNKDFRAASQSLLTEVKLHNYVCSAG